jgi:hypothetical protein
MGLRDDMEYGQYQRGKVVAELGQWDRVWLDDIDALASKTLRLCKAYESARLSPIAEQRIHDFRLALEEAMKILRGDDE